MCIMCESSFGACRRLRKLKRYVLKYCIFIRVSKITSKYGLSLLLVVYSAKVILAFAKLVCGWLWAGEMGLDSCCGCRCSVDLSM